MGLCFNLKLYSKLQNILITLICSCQTTAPKLKVLLGLIERLHRDRDSTWTNLLTREYILVGYNIIARTQDDALLS